MGRPLLSLIALVASLILLAGGAAAQERIALVIGNSAYQNAPRLDNPTRTPN